MKRRAMDEFQVSLIRGLVLIIFIQVTEWLRMVKKSFFFILPYFFDLSKVSIAVFRREMHILIASNP